MSKPIAGAHDYTPQEDIRDVLQLVALILERPCINPRGTGVNRAVAIGYAELNVIKKRLGHAVEVLEAKTEAANFPRPMGATPIDKARRTLTRDDLPDGWTVEFVNMAGVGRGYDLKERGASRGMFTTLQEAVQSALELSAP